MHSKAVENLVENYFSVLLVASTKNSNQEIKVLSPPGLSKCCYYMSLALHMIASSYKCND